MFRLDYEFTESSVSKLLTSSQRFIHDLDPDNSQDVTSVRHEVWSLIEDYKMFIKDKNTDYKTMKIPEIMDFYSKFHYLAYKTPRTLLSVVVKAGTSRLTPSRPQAYPDPRFIGSNNKIRGRGEWGCYGTSKRIGPFGYELM